MLQLVASRAGPPTAIVRGAYLHSKYDPRAEAERFVAETLADGTPSTVLLLGAGLGYLVHAVQRRSPGVRVLPVFYDKDIFEAACARAAANPGGEGGNKQHTVDFRGAAGVPSSAWHPRQPDSLLEHLRREISELDSEGLVVVEWPGSARLFPDTSREANLAVRQLLRELRGSLATTAAFGRRWLRNAFRNYVCLERFSPKPPPPAVPVAITASGPSLEEALPLLARYRNRFCLWALPSSLLALRNCGLYPDLVVLTDPGYYAAAHLYPGDGSDLEIAMPLSAACGTWRVGARVVPLSQGTFFEGLLWGLRSLTPIPLPSFGTVAASALTLAALLGAPQILMAGLDLAERDVISHARPNVFDLFLEPGSGRFSPFLHRRFSLTQPSDAVLQAAGSPAGPARAVGDRPSLALDTYRGWFANLQARPGPPLYRLLPSRVALPAFAGLDADAFCTYAEALPQVSDGRRGTPQGAASPGPTAAGSGGAHPSGRAASASALLLDWQRKLSRAQEALGSQSLATVLEDPLLLPLCYYSDAAALAEVHRRLRLDGASPAADRLGALIAATAVFLDSIRSALEVA